MSAKPRVLWRYRDYVRDEWIYSHLPVNPEKWRYVERYEVEARFFCGIKLKGARRAR